MSCRQRWKYFKRLESFYDGKGRRRAIRIIAGNADKGSEDLFKAAAIARAVNEAREKELQQGSHHQQQHYYYNNNNSSS